jgi:release factor glutamine methyltransferase
VTRELVRQAALRLADAGVASPDFDAAELLAHVLGTTRSRLALVEAVTPDQAATYDALVTRRAAREPLQHLTGSAAFRYVELAVGPGVFVPRPETELLAGWAVEQATAVVAAGRVPVVVDLCTGSGAIALAVTTEVPTAEVHAVELGGPAVEWAARNLAGTGVDLRHGDMADAFPDLDGTVDVVVCNPPYIPLEAYESVAAEARDFDPPLSLWSGDDGLDAIRGVLAVAAEALAAGGVLTFEHAEVQSAAVVSLTAASGTFADVHDNLDLTGRPRYVTARRVPRMGG